VWRLDGVVEMLLPVAMTGLHFYLEGTYILDLQCSAYLLRRSLVAVIRTTDDCVRGRLLYLKMGGLADVDGIFEASLQCQKRTSASPTARLVLTPRPPVR